MSEPRPCRLRFARYRPHRRACRGAAAVEFALVFVIFFLLFYGIVAYGLVLTLQQSLTLAAAEGARAAVQDAPNEAARCTQAETRANGVLSWLPKDSITVNAKVADCAAARCVTVVVSYNYAGYPIVPALPSLGISIPDNLGATATVQL